jgi:hypothetical protein
VTAAIGAGAIGLVVTGGAIPGLAQQPKAQQGQQQKSPPPQQPQEALRLAPPKAYKPVAIQLPKVVNDPSFTAFRKELAGIAQKKDRAALARLVAANFFWIPEDKDIADKSKPAIDNIAKAIGLDNDPVAWEALASIAEETTADPDAQHPGVLCGPGEPSFDDKAAEALANATQTEPTEWGYPVRNGVEVHSGLETTSPVTEKLGLYLVRVYPDESPAAAVHGDVLRVVTPSGKLGYVAAESILPLATDQLCYAKEGNSWKIVGMIGGYPGPQ